VPSSIATSAHRGMVSMPLADIAQPPLDCTAASTTLPSAPVAYSLPSAASSVRARRASGVEPRIVRGGRRRAGTAMSARHPLQGPGIRRVVAACAQFHVLGAAADQFVNHAAAARETVNAPGRWSVLTPERKPSPPGPEQNSPPALRNLRMTRRVGSVHAIFQFVPADPTWP